MVTSTNQDLRIQTLI